MAYRDLIVGDYVRYVESGTKFHGYDAEVISVDNSGAGGKQRRVLLRVRAGRGSYFSEPMVTFWVRPERTILLDKYASQRVMERYAAAARDEDYLVDKDLPEPCGTCACCEYHNR